jgi:hypothetical protein
MVKADTQARGLPPFTLQPPGAATGSLQSVMDAPLLQYAHGFLADMDAVLQLPRVRLPVEQLVTDAMACWPV